MEQLLLPYDGVGGSPGQGTPSRVVAASAPAAGAVREAPGAGAAGTRGRPPRERREALRRAPVELSERERFELELHALRVEWAADGGDGSICSTTEAIGWRCPWCGRWCEVWEESCPLCEDDEAIDESRAVGVQALNLEWILHGPLLEALAIIQWKPLETQPSALEEPEKSREAAA